DARRDSNTDMIFFLLTDIRSESSRLVFSGDGAAETVGEAFGKEAVQGVLLEDVVSRKKQFIPAVLGAIDRM
ncbi:MAG: inorganic diphosphatase, partial [Firmicutes bacterium]|nr:inorganic diphosphatase [Bacillota bacterium]